MTKKWSSTRSLDGTKRAASKRSRRQANDLAEWLTENDAKPSVKYDEDTGERHIVFTIDLRK